MQLFEEITPPLYVIKGVLGIRRLAEIEKTIQTPSCTANEQYLCFGVWNLPGFNCICKMHSA